MKRFLFLDNYRGFSSTVVPLVDVNFMVGENSTGKTSLLKMLRLISNPELFMGLPMFARPSEVLFGHFNEMASIHSADRSYFRLGTVDDYTDGPRPRNKPLARGVLSTFKEQDGMPKLSQFTFAQLRSEITLRFEGDKVFFRANELSRDATVESLRESFERWGIEHGTKLDEWQELEIPKVYPKSPIPIYLALHFASEKLSKSRDMGPVFWDDSFNKFVWIAPIRTQPRRTYDEPNTPYSSEGDHIPYVIRRVLGSQSEAKKFHEFMKGVGKSSGLFESISINRYGPSNDAPFEVDAVLDGKAVNLHWMGYGVSQSLPILVELFDRKEECTFAIQQPEVHLHPRAQAALGDLFYKAAADTHQRFLIETHSDFLIDRFRLNCRKAASKKMNTELPNSQVLFFERHNRCNTVTSLPISSDGNLPADQPRGYREFFIKEEATLLEL